LNTDQNREENTDSDLMSGEMAELQRVAAGIAWKITMILDAG